MAAIGAILQFNEGASGKHVVMEKAGIAWGDHSESGSARKDKNRISKAKKKASQQQKRVRKKMRAAKLKAEKERKAMEGASYGAGKFNDVDPLQCSSSDEDIPLSLLQSKNSKKKWLF